VYGPAFNDALSYRAAEAPIGREVQREVLTGQEGGSILSCWRDSGPSTSFVALHRERAIARAQVAERDPNAMLN